jgi:addiction module HigA family antidote
MAENMKREFEPIHPGEILLEEFLKPMGLTQYRLAKDISVPQRRISEIVHGRRAITADTALRLGRFFGMEAEFWLNLDRVGAVWQAGFRGEAAGCLAWCRVADVQALHRVVLSG